MSPDGFEIPTWKYYQFPKEDTKSPIVHNYNGKRINDLTSYERQKLCQAYHKRIGVDSIGFITVLGEWICPCKYCKFFDSRKQFCEIFKERVSAWQLEHRDQYECRTLPEVSENDESMITV